MLYYDNNTYLAAVLVSSIFLFGFLFCSDDSITTIIPKLQKSQNVLFLGVVALLLYQIIKKNK